MMNDLIKESKRLAYLLRHSCLPDHNGWVSIDLLIREHGFTIEELMQVVSDDAKGRFELSSDGFAVRAIYGHSVDVDLQLIPSSPPAVLFHGSGAKYIEGIMREGLKPRKRNYVHLSENIDTARQVGARHGDPVILTIDAEAMCLAGHKFYKAQNEIWLSDAVDIRYITISN